MTDTPAFATHDVAFDRFKEIVVHPLSDVHIGASRHNAAKLKEKLAAIRKAGDNHRVLLLGDLADINSTVSKHYDPMEGETPQRELEMLVEVFKPLGDRIDLIIPGNHEDRLAKVGLDYTQQFAALIGRGQVYSPIPTVLRYCWMPRPPKPGGEPHGYRARAEVFCHHGYGGGRNEGGKLDKVKALALNKPDCHAYLMGHVHGHAATQDDVPIGWPPRMRRRLFAITGTYLQSAGYAIRQNLPPGVTGSPVVHLNFDSTRDDVVATLTLGAP